MRLCTECTRNSEAWSHQTAPRDGSECGRAFDMQGMPIQDESVTCPIHEPISSRAAHTRAPTPTRCPHPPGLGLVDETGTAGGGGPAVSPHEVR